MRRIAVAFLVVLSGSPLSAAESSLDETLKEMEMRDLLLEELDECLRVMETSACVKTYEERCADAFTSDEKNIAGTAKPNEADATSPLDGTPVWRLVDYPKLSYTREAFPAATAVEAGFTTGE